MSELFAQTPSRSPQTDWPKPLSVRMRPQSLKDMVGQSHILKEGSLLRRMIESDRLSSVILYGPPGVGKTTLAGIISKETRSHFEVLSAVTHNVSDVRKILENTRKYWKLDGRKTILFIDEIHRFSKSQQDVLMPDIEEGNPILIGATTHNPFFSVISPLLSRATVFELKALSREEVEALLRKALGDKERGLGGLDVQADDEALKFLAEVSDGDARRALNALEVAVLSSLSGKKKTVKLDVAVCEESIQKKQVVYDRGEDEHYDTASAFIKSMRGSDPDAALYWMAKMLEAGEDPRFIARRIVILASEDVGNADPQALVLANAAFQVAEFVGLPECRIPLAQAVCYVASAPKSNASYLAIEKALEDVRSGRTLQVPNHLRDKSYKGAQTLGRGEGYQYAHDFEGHYVEQDYLPEERRYYFPSEEGEEKRVKARLDALRLRKENSRGNPANT